MGERVSLPACMRNIKLILEYDGTGYSGWQVQPGQKTIEGVLKGCIRKVTGEEVKLRAAGRTDAGVHALGQVVNFYTNTTIPAPSLQRALNSLLPPDIVVRSAEDVGEDFDARRSSKAKIYLYLIFNSPSPSAIYRHYSWYVREPLDLDLMRRGSTLLIGEMDFSSFRATGCTATHPVRSIESIRIFKEGDLVKIEVKGKAFLRHMVRNIVGTLVDLGRGRFTIEDMERIIEAKDRTKAGISAPARGLFLKEVEY